MSTVILAIDTATPAVTAGVVRLDDGNVEVLAERVTDDARAHAEQLTPNVVGALADARLTVDDLDAVVVGCGPGPFTGLRVGMASAAAYGHALDLPVYGVCSLDAIGIDTDRATSWWSPMPAAARCTGLATATVSASTGPRSTRRPTCPAPRRWPDRRPRRLSTAAPPRLSDRRRARARRRRLDDRARSTGSAVLAPSRRQAADRRWPDDGRSTVR